MLFRVVSRSCPTLLGTVSGQFQAVSGSVARNCQNLPERRRPTAPESARRRPKAPGSARKCPK
eukprot:15449624-Alexandrium_andersonii.AAC.1